MKEKLAGIGALVSAALASVCCLGPLVLVGLGLGGVGLAAGFAKYRPFFLGLTAILLTAAFYLAYRKREVTCADGRCERRSGSKTMKAALWIITVVAVGMATFPNWSTLLLAKPSEATDANVETILFAVSGMHCSACPVSIEQSLKKLPGVHSASVNYDKAEATVQIELGKVSVEELIEAVSAAGPYTAEVKNANEAPDVQSN